VQKPPGANHRMQQQKRVVYTAHVCVDSSVKSKTSVNSASCDQNHVL
jgi:hypothetical protein